jgi:hypothetical protein
LRSFEMITGKAAFGHTQSVHREISSFGSPPTLSFRARVSALEDDLDIRHEGVRGQLPPTSVVNDLERSATFGFKIHCTFSRLFLEFISVCGD